jgi:histidinol-phosphate/aromatic aminotransferase/cobyric acid decarboxylase-like protein
MRPPWSVNAFAQAAAIAALADEAHLQETLAKLAGAKSAFVRELMNLGLSVLPSACHFFLVRVGEARPFREALLKRGLLVRAGDSFGLPAFVRLATLRPEETAWLLAALSEWGGANQAAG